MVNLLVHYRQKGPKAKLEPPLLLQGFLYQTAKLDPK